MPNFDTLISKFVESRVLTDEFKRSIIIRIYIIKYESKQGSKRGRKFT
jgi:hypothetical protein